MALYRTNIFLPRDDWDYLEKLAKAMKKTRGELIRETISNLTGIMRKAIGENPGKEQIDITNYYRIMMIEAAQALGQVSEIPETWKNTGKKIARRAKQGIATR